MKKLKPTQDAPKETTKPKIRKPINPQPETTEPPQMAAESGKKVASKKPKKSGPSMMEIYTTMFTKHAIFVKN